MLAISVSIHLLILAALASVFPVHTEMIVAKLSGAFLPSNDSLPATSQPAVPPPPLAAPVHATNEESALVVIKPEPGPTSDKRKPAAAASQPRKPADRILAKTSPPATAPSSSRPIPRFDYPDEDFVLNCRPAEIQVPDELGRIMAKENGDFCYNNLLTRMSSEKCKERCEIDELAKNVKPPLQYKGIGTPGALLCNQLGGHSQVVHLMIDGEKTSLDRCVVNGEFVSLGLLFKRWSETTIKEE